MLCSLFSQMGYYSISIIFALPFHATGCAVGTMNCSKVRQKWVRGWWEWVVAVGYPLRVSKHNFYFTVKAPRHKGTWPDPILAAASPPGEARLGTRAGETQQWYLTCSSRRSGYAIFMIADCTLGANEKAGTSSSFLLPETACLDCSPSSCL